MEVRGMIERRRWVPVVMAAMFAGLVPGVAGAQAPGASAGTGPSLEGTTWQLAAVAGAADPAMVAGMGATLALAGGQAGGFGGCNQFTASYTLDGDALSFGEPATTKMACEDTKMSFESVYLGALPTVASYTIADGSLTLLDGNGTAALTYTAPAPRASAAAPTGLVGTWTVVEVNDGAQAVSAVPSEPVLTVTFGSDGSVSGFGGCNQFGGPYVSAEDTIGIGPLNATRMACGDTVDSVEQQLMAALQASTAWTLKGATLELRDDSGALQVSLSAGGPAPSPA
jgi:heat shock protein HslJ